LVCIATIIIQHGPETRYLFPLFGIFTLWIGIFVDGIQERFRWLPVLVLATWVGFYSITNYRAYQAEGLIEEGVKPVKFDKHSIYDVLDFLTSKKISVAYADYGTSGPGTFLSMGEINISEYTDNPSAKTQKAKSMGNPNFAILARGRPVTIYRNYLQEKGIEFKTATVAGYEIFLDFVGKDAEINNLRSLISAS
jgi:hypothetical protein